MNRNSNERATNLPQQTFNHVPAGTTQWSVQGSNLRPPVNVASPKWRDWPSCPCVIRGISRANARRIRERAEPSGNRRAIRGR